VTHIRLCKMPEERSRAYFSVTIYAARLAASSLVSDMSGILGCGLSKKSAIFEASRLGIRAIVAKGGTASLPVL
jgi:hypothetical protein